MFRSRQTIIRELCSLLKLYYSIHNSIRICNFNSYFCCVMSKFQQKLTYSVSNRTKWLYSVYNTGWFKKWTQLKSKRRLNTRQTVGCGIPSSLLALRVDLRGLRSKLSWIRLRFSSDTRGRPELLPLHRQPIYSNWWFQRQILFLVGGLMLKRRRNALYTAVADSVLMNSRTQKILCCIVAILLSTDAAARLCVRRAL